jgi:cytochrome c-type biogenesis protein CcmH/NrfF
MLYSPALTPLLHGAVGILDELLLFGAPIVVVIIILTIASQRARRNARPRERTRTPSQTVQPLSDSTDTRP